MPLSVWRQLRVERNYHMKRIVLSTVALLVLALSSSHALTQEARSLYVTGMHVGYSSPFGNYNGIGSFEWTGGSLTASELLDPTYHVGLEIGKVSNDHLLAGIGFRYTKINVNDAIGDYLTPIDTSILRFNQYDINLDCNYYLTNLYEESLSPYFGGELIAGFTSFAPPGFRSETKFSFGVAVNFGLDMKVWSAADKRSFITLASINSWQLAAGGNRPRYLNIGGGLRYFFRP